MMREILFLISSFLVCWKGVHPFLDIDELKNIHYDIDIIDEPVLLGRPVDQEVIYMTSKYGQRYECQLPDIIELELEMEEEKAAGELGISELLKPMEAAPCIRKTKDWWSYEFCYGKQIQQFHLENDNIVGDIVVLGVYDSETDWRDNATTDSRKNRLNRYHSQHYVNGSTCDLSGKSRQAEVRFHCADGEGDSIARIDEPSTCTYILTIHTTKICHHPYLKPPPKVKPKSVLCSPALTQNQFDIYNYHQEQAELELKKEKERLKLKQEEQLKWAQQLLSASTDTKADGEQSSDGEDETINKETTDQIEELLAHQNADHLRSLGLKPEELSRYVQGIMNSVQDSMDAIDQEIDSETETTAADDTKDKDEGVDDELEGQDFKSLISQFRQGINDNAMEDGEAARMRALADELEKSYMDVESLEQLMTDEEVIPKPPEDADHEDSASGETPEDSSDSDDLPGKTEKEMEQLLVSKVNELIKKLNAEPKAVAGSSDDSMDDDTAVGEADAEPDSSPDKVKVRVTRIKLDPETGKDKTSRDVNLYDPEQRSLEEAIQDHLEQAGIKVEGGKIELKVVTYKPDSWPDQEGGDDSITILTEEETTYFKNIVSGILGHRGQAEIGRHHKLEDSYRFHWDQSNHRITEEKDEREESNDNAVFT